VNCSGLCSEARNLLRGGVMRCFLSLAVLVLILVISPGQPWMPRQIPLPISPSPPRSLPGQTPSPLAPGPPWSLPGQTPSPLAPGPPWSLPGQTPSRVQTQGDQVPGIWMCKDKNGDTVFSNRTGQYRECRPYVVSPGLREAFLKEMLLKKKQPAPQHLLPDQSSTKGAAIGPF
jgi:hypothetical protein